MHAPGPYDAIPKVELHCHVEGAVRPTTVVELARKNRRTLPTNDPSELYRYTSLDTFLDIFWLVQALLSDRSDWTRIAYEATVDAAAHGLRYRELFFTPARHLAAGQSLADIVAGLSEGVSQAERETGVRSRLVCDLDRAFGPAAALELAEQLAVLRAAGRAELVIGFGMDSTERGVDHRGFTMAYAVARRAGLRLTGHAGEDGGPENIRIALDVLGVERIDHGIAVMDDPELVARMAAERIPLTVCPSSNVLIANRYTSLAEHPFRSMRDAGLLATINTDDPAMTDLDLGREYAAVASALGYTFGEMCAIALDSIDATWLDASERSALRVAFEAEIAEISGIAEMDPPA
jgi:adenosine deaminase